MISFNDILDEVLNQIKQPLWENWYIKEKIGSGAFSAVYKVEAKRSTNRTSVAALKIEPITVDGKLFMDEERKRAYLEQKRAAVETEASIMYSLRKSPYIVTYEEEDMRELYINNQFEGYYYLIRMELLQSVSNQIYNKTFDLSEKNVLNLALNIGQGISAAHRIGVIHRDIKLDNFFIDELGVYKLGDFNIAKQSGIAKTFAGTHGYLAPEIYQAKADSKAIYTNQADIYSFGICLYQLANMLYFPFEEQLSTDDAIDRRMNGAKLPPPRCASPEFARIILKACEFTTEKRYEDIDDMVGDLQRLSYSQNHPPVQKSEKNTDNKNPMRDLLIYSETISAEEGIFENTIVQNSAATVFAEVPEGYSNSANSVNQISSVSSDLSIGDEVEFGSHYVNGSNEKRSIIWEVLSVKGDKALIISKYALDARPYHNEQGDVTWEKSHIRKWLNEVFYNSVFSNREKAKIVAVQLTTPDNRLHITKGGNDTVDNVFLLSMEEAKYYFPTNEKRIAMPTEYARLKNLLISKGNGCWWWLRSSGDSQSYAADVDYGGDVDSYGSSAFTSLNGVRPALWMDTSGRTYRKTIPQAVPQSEPPEASVNFVFSSVYDYNHGGIRQSIGNQVAVGGEIEIGRYFYDSPADTAPIKWQVLAVVGEKALIISKRVLDCMRYHDVDEDITWENSSIRKWLNNDFIASAFSDAERKIIIPTIINTRTNAIYNTQGGNTTTDKIFLLSIDEAAYYLNSEEKRVAQVTKFAKQKGLFVSNKKCWWWLRNPGNNQHYAADVDYGGDIDFYGSDVYNSVSGIRPVVWINCNLL